MEDVKKGGIFIYRLYGNEDLKQEALELKAKAEKVKVLVDNSYSKKGNKKFEGSSLLFFSKCLSEISVSKEMEYLLQAFALTALRKAQRRDEKGIVYTGTEITWISRFSKMAAGCLNPLAQRKIVEFWQKEFTASSVQLLREEAAKTTLFEGEEKKRLLFMLSEESVRCITPDPRYEPRFFGCLFYEYKAILCRLSEEQGLACFKSIEKDAKPFTLLLQPNEKKGPFKLVPETAYCAFKTTSALVVFEGVTALTREEFSKRIGELDFCQMILACAAIEAPFEPASTLAEVKIEEAREEILLYRDFYAKNVECFLRLDHVYANSFLGEIEIGDLS
jgi:hypothetical protein